MSQWRRRTRKRSKRTPSSAAGIPWASGRCRRRCATSTRRRSWRASSRSSISISSAGRPRRRRAPTRSGTRRRRSGAPCGRRPRPRGWPSPGFRGAAFEWAAARSSRRIPERWSRATASFATSSRPLPSRWNALCSRKDDASSTLSLSETTGRLSSDLSAASCCGTRIRASSRKSTSKRSWPSPTRKPTATPRTSQPSIHGRTSAPPGEDACSAS
mmetsp:Transcript_179/g.670  ORF Transcript_179/g.670 Transcript_179/m.670 type:complete len:215 (-) Transcript_179:1085-1729(-)